MKLSILIPTLKSRKKTFEKLKKSIKRQEVVGVEILSCPDNGERSIGEKRNALLKSARGKYIAFIDDDDRISPHYISEVMKGIEDDVDCCSLVGEITTDGKSPKIFVHSIKYDKYFESESVYYRPPNHLNVIKKSLVKGFRFPETDFGEDTNWAMKICNSGVLKTEYKIKKTIYFYDYLTSKELV